MISGILSDFGIFVRIFIATSLIRQWNNGFLKYLKKNPLNDFNRCWTFKKSWLILYSSLLYKMGHDLTYSRAFWLVLYVQNATYHILLLHPLYMSAKQFEYPRYLWRKDKDYSFHLSGFHFIIWNVEKTTFQQFYLYFIFFIIGTRANITDFSQPVIKWITRTTITNKHKKWKGLLRMIWWSLELFHIEWSLLKKNKSIYPCKTMQNLFF